MSFNLPRGEQFGNKVKSLISKFPFISNWVEAENLISFGEKCETKLQPTQFHKYDNSHQQMMTDLNELQLLPQCC